jgi:LysM repeat protein
MKSKKSKSKKVTISIPVRKTATLYVRVKASNRDKVSKLAKEAGVSLAVFMDNAIEQRL